MLSKYVEAIRNKVKKKKFICELNKSKKRGQMTNWLTTKFIDMVDECGNSSRYSNYSQLEDLKAHAVMQLTKSWKRFDTERFDNAAVFFTTVVGCAFAYYLNSEQRAENTVIDYNGYVTDGNSTSEIDVDDE